MLMLLQSLLILWAPQKNIKLNCQHCSLESKLQFLKRLIQSIQLSVLLVSVLRYPEIMHWKIGILENHHLKHCSKMKNNYHGGVGTLQVNCFLMLFDGKTGITEGFWKLDPTTKKFLAENVDPIFGFPQLVRFSWSTVGLILKTKGVKVEWEEDEEQNNSQKSVQNFFVKKSEGPMRKHPYFNHRKIKPAVKLL